MLDCVKYRDPLVIHDILEDGQISNVVKPKSKELMKGIEAIKGHVFRPSLLSCHWLFKGNL